jgi:zinc/manganese transport system permease protein
VTPPAAAQRFTDRPGRAFWLGIVLSLVITWVAIVLAWYVPIAPAFFITTLAFAVYIAARGAQTLRRRAGRATSVTLHGAKA